MPPTTPKLKTLPYKQLEESFFPWSGTKEDGTIYLGYIPGGY